MTLCDVITYISGMTTYTGSATRAVFDLLLFFSFFFFYFFFFINFDAVDFRGGGFFQDYNNSKNFINLMILGWVDLIILYNFALIPT